MTLIVGIKCSDGVVMGADGAATFGALGTRTIRQPMRKLTVISDCAVIGVSGPGSLAQQFASIISVLLPELQQSMADHLVALRLQQSLWVAAGEAFSIARVAQQTIGQVALESALSGSVLALPVAGVLRLYQFSQQCAPEEATVDLPFVAVGSGQSIADPFLAFLRKVFWPKRLPTVADARLATFWTLSHCIETNPGGVADPKQMITITQNDQGCDIRESTGPELLEYEQHIAQAVDYLGKFQELMRPETIESPSTEPPMPQP
jgi:hypothetical protein